MLCLKYKKRDLVCVKKSILLTILYSFLVAFILILMDKVYAMNNEYFMFKFTSKELLNKLLFLAFAISLIPKQTLRISIYLLLILFSFFQYVHFEYFGKNISAIEFYLFGTNFQETFEILNTLQDIIFIPLIIAAVSFTLLYFIDSKIGRKSFKYKYSVHIILVILLALNAQVFYLTNFKEGKLKQRESFLLYPTTNRHSARNFFISLNYFMFGVLPKKLFNNTTTFPLLKKPLLVNNDINRTVILVIGESLRYDTFALYDNKLTPKLQTLKNDKNFFYKKVYSGGTMTKVSVSTLIHRLKYPGGLTQIAQEDNCLFKLAKENDFNTYFLSGQSASHLQVLRDIICPKYIDKLIDRDSFETLITPTGYDEDLQTLLSKLDILKTNSFIVLQQRGSHSPYEKQYSKAYDKYTPYENTALYTDHSIYELINYINTHTKGEIFFFYVSDHGELLGEDGKKGHGHLKKQVYEVPFLMYTNTQDEKIKEQFKYIQNHYDISNYILSLLGYDAKLNHGEDRTMYILNADLDGFSGYGVINIKDGVESKMQRQRP